MANKNISFLSHIFLAYRREQRILGHTLPAIMTSVALLIPSIKDSRQPYKLSNLLLVTESLTLIAGILSSPFSNILYKLWTPVVVSSETPLIAVRSWGYLVWITRKY